MDQPLEIAFHEMDASPALRQRIQERADRMERHYPHITSAHVVVEPDARSAKGTTAFRVRVEARVPGKELVSSRAGNGDHHDPYQAVNDAFDAMDKQLDHFRASQRGEVKAHDGPPAGRIRQVFSDYGFVETTDGQDVWFHRASVENDGFDALKPGDPVELSISAVGNEGMGPQASSVRPRSPLRVDG